MSNQWMLCSRKVLNSKKQKSGERLLCSLRPGPSAQPVHAYQHWPQRHCFLLLNKDNSPCCPQGSVCGRHMLLGWGRFPFGVVSPHQKQSKVIIVLLEQATKRSQHCPLLASTPEALSLPPFSLLAAPDLSLSFPETAQQQLDTGNAILSPRTPPAAAPTRAHSPQNRFF